jgi:hypothetical protein
MAPTLMSGRNAKLNCPDKTADHRGDPRTPERLFIRVDELIRT